MHASGSLRSPEAPKAERLRGTTYHRPMAPRELDEWAAEGGQRTLSARQVLELWGAQRRSFQVVQQIARDVRERGLRIDPPIVDVPIDEDVVISAITESGVGSTAEAVDSRPDSAPKRGLPGEQRAQVRMKVSWIASANRSVETVNPSDTLTKATSRMLRRDYSQLAVMSSPRGEPNAISWESIAKAQLSTTMRDPTLAEASIPATCVNWDDDLLPLIPQIISQGFVFVRGRDRTLRGIVTTADLSQQYEDLAQPFLLLGEIERGLRVILDDAFTVEELVAVRAEYDNARPVSGAADLTMGEMQRLLEPQESFDKLGWAMDRAEFVAAFDEVRELRNDVMHFSPDAMSADELRLLLNFQSMLQKLAAPLLG